MISIQKYTPSHQQEWDSFVDTSKNGTFMLKRGYMDYHSARFVDYSLMCYDENDLIAVLPCSLHGTEVRSHGGLTYGGLIVTRKITASKVLDVFRAIVEYLKLNGIAGLLYKRVPSIYYSYPSDEDVYALYRLGATLVRRDLSTCIDLSDKIRFSERRRRGVKSATKNGISISLSTDYEAYVNILADVLRVHNAAPVHSADELRLLADRFPDNIKLYAAFRGEKMLAGVLMFVTPMVAHSQYIANSEEGRTCGALDLAMDHLINEVFAGKRYFDFGISTEDNGQFLNEGLVAQKQEFGGRGITYDFYRLNID